MADTSLKIGIDQSSAKAAGDALGKTIAERTTAGAQKGAEATKDAFGAAAKGIEKDMSSAMEVISQRTTKLVGKVFGEEQLKKIGSEGLQSTFHKGFTELVKSSKFKEDVKKIGDSTALSISKQLGIKVDSKQIQKVITTGLVSAEKEALHRNGPEGLVGKVLRGGRAAKAQLTEGGIPGAPQEEQKAGGIGLGLMAKLGVAGLALGAVNGLLSGMVTAFKGEKKAALGLAPFAGVNAAFGGLRAGAGLDFSREETVGALSPAAHMGVGEGAYSTLLRSQRLGAGGEMGWRVFWGRK
jgi:hypothetical protein